MCAAARHNVRVSVTKSSQTWPVRQDSFIYVTKLIWQDLFIYVTWLIHIVCRNVAMSPHHPPHFKHTDLLECALQHRIANILHFSHTSVFQNQDPDYFGFQAMQISWLDPACVYGYDNRAIHAWWHAWRCVHLRLEQSDRRLSKAESVGNDSQVPQSTRLQIRNCNSIRTTQIPALYTVGHETIGFAPHELVIRGTLLYIYKERERAHERERARDRKKEWTLEASHARDNLCHTYMQDAMPHSKCILMKFCWNHKIMMKS